MPGVWVTPRLASVVPVKEFGNRIRKILESQQGKPTGGRYMFWGLTYPWETEGHTAEGSGAHGWMRMVGPEQGPCEHEQRSVFRTAYPGKMCLSVTSLNEPPLPAQQLPSEKAASLGDESSRTELNYNWYEIEVPHLFWYHQFIMSSLYSLSSRSCQPNFSTWILYSKYLKMNSLSHCNPASPWTLVFLSPVARWPWSYHTQTHPLVRSLALSAPG